jgi:hypothetical protein
MPQFDSAEGGGGCLGICLMLRSETAAMTSDRLNQEGAAMESIMAKSKSFDSGLLERKCSGYQLGKPIRRLIGLACNPTNQRW